MRSLWRTAPPPVSIPSLRLLKTMQAKGQHVDSVSLNSGDLAFAVVSISNHSRPWFAVWRDLWKGKPAQVDSHIEVFDRSGSPLFYRKEEKKHVTVGWGRGGSQILLGIEAETVRIYDIYSHAFVGEYSLPHSAGRVMAFSTDGLFAATAVGRQVYLYRLYGYEGFSPRLVRVMEIPESNDSVGEERSRITSLVFSPRNLSTGRTSLAVIQGNQTVSVMDKDTGKRLLVFTPDYGPNPRINGLQFDARGDLLACATRHGTFWFKVRSTHSIPNPEDSLEYFPEDYGNDITALSANPKGWHWIRATRNGAWRLYDAYNGDTFTFRPGVAHTLAIKLLEWSPALVSLHPNRWIKFWALDNVRAY